MNELQISDGCLLLYNIFQKNVGFFLNYKKIGFVKDAPINKNALQSDPLLIFDSPVEFNYVSSGYSTLRMTVFDCSWEAGLSDQIHRGAMISRGDPTGFNL